MAYCPVCGAQEAPGQKFCSSCGSPAPAMGAASSAASPPTPPTPPGGVTPYPGAPVYQPAPAYQGEWSNQPRIAGFWWRVLAFILDEVVIDLVLYFALHDSSSITFYEQATVAVIANFLYFGLMVGLAKGQTLGMRACRLRVVNAKDHGPVSFNQAMVRAVTYSVLLLIASLYNYHVKRTTNLTNKQAEAVLRHGLLYLALAAPHFLDLLWAAWDKQRQTLHDKFATTVVIRTR